MHRLRPGPSQQRRGLPAVRVAALRARDPTRFNWSRRHALLVCSVVALPVIGCVLGCVLPIGLEPIAWVVCGVVVGLVLLATFATQRSRTAWQCRGCGYDCGGLGATDRCPECGGIG
jgi:hypothetical protein